MKDITQSGMQWVSSKALEIARATGMKVDNLSWQVDEGNHQYLLTVEGIHGKRAVKSFEEDVLRNCCTNPSVQDDICKRLATFLGFFNPKK